MGSYAIVIIWFKFVSLDYMNQIGHYKFDQAIIIKKI